MGKWSGLDCFQQYFCCRLVGWNSIVENILESYGLVQGVLYRFMLQQIDPDPLGYSQPIMLLESCLTLGIGEIIIVLNYEAGLVKFFFK